MSHDYLSETPLLDYRTPTIRKLTMQRGWMQLSDKDRIGAAHDFVRNDLLFGYNVDDALPASRVLADGFGQCNTKGTLLMALLRALEIPCRLHGFTIDKRLQRGVVPEVVYPLAPRHIIHSWVEVQLDGDWLELEGFILDQQVLAALQAKFPERDTLCAYGAGTDCLQEPDVAWTGQSTYIQKTGIDRDFGVFDDPDAFYANHRQLTGLRDLIYRHVIRHWMNRRVRRMREGIIPVIPGGEANLVPAIAHPHAKEAV